MNGQEVIDKYTTSWKANYKKQALELLNKGGCGMDVIETLGRYTTINLELKDAIKENRVDEVVEAFLEKYKGDIVAITELYCELNWAEWDLSETNPFDKTMKDLHKHWAKIPDMVCKEYDEADRSFFWRISD